MAKRIYVGNLPVTLDEVTLVDMTKSVGELKLQKFKPGTAGFVTPGGHIYQVVAELKSIFASAGMSEVVVNEQLD